MRNFKDVFNDNKFTPDNVSDLEGKLFFEGDQMQAYLVRFSVLLFLSTIIAAFIEDGRSCLSTCGKPLAV